MTRAALVLALLCARPLAAQQMGDTVQVRASVSAAIRASVGDSLAAWCAVRWRVVPARRSVFVDSVVPAPVTINPDCGEDAPVLVRPFCLFFPSEFLTLRRATGLPLRVLSPDARTL